MVNRVGTAIGVLFLTLLLLGRTTIQHIYHRRDCIRFNIDNVEMRAKIDVPALKNVDCHYDETTRTKTNIFHLDTSIVNIAQYVVRNRLQLEGDLFRRQDSRTDTDYRIELNPKTAQLMITVQYKD